MWKEDALAKKAKARQRGGQGGVLLCQNSDKAPIDRKKELARIAGVSHDTYHKSATIEREAPPEIRDAVRAGKMSINRGYESIRETRTPKRRTVATKKRGEKSFPIDSKAAARPFRVAEGSGPRPEPTYTLNIPRFNPEKAAAALRLVFDEVFLQALANELLKGTSR
jgi:hypothetical protein